MQPAYGAFILTDQQLLNLIKYCIYSYKLLHIYSMLFKIHSHHHCSGSLYTSVLLMHFTIIPIYFVGTIYYISNL